MTQREKSSASPCIWLACRDLWLLLAFDLGVSIKATLSCEQCHLLAPSNYAS